MMFLDLDFVERSDWQSEAAYAGGGLVLDVRGDGTYVLSRAANALTSEDVDFVIVNGSVWYWFG
jgi:hypothetical protein